MWCAKQLASLSINSWVHLVRMAPLPEAYVILQAFKCLAKLQVHLHTRMAWPTLSASAGAHRGSSWSG